MKMNPELLYKYLENRASATEMEQVLDWLDADAANRQELDQMDKIFAASIIHSDIPTGRIAAVAPKRMVTMRSVVRYAMQLAAVVAIGAGVTWAMMEHQLSVWSERTAILEVPAGQHLNVTLQDGTIVWLNSGSRLEYPLVFARGERRVKISGEAMFDVTHDDALPFVVETFACDVEVLGTKFDVEAYEQEGLFSTALLRGRVRVINRLSPQKIDMRENEQVRLVGVRLSLEIIENPDIYLWTQGLISIKGVSFSDLMRRFEKSFGVKIVVESAKMPEINYNHGKIRISDGVDSALRQLQMGASFDYTRTEDGHSIVIH